MREDTVAMVNHLSDWILKSSSMFRASVPIVMQLPDDWWEVANDLSREYNINANLVWEILSHILWRWGKDFAPIEIYMMVSEAMEYVQSSFWEWE